MSNAAKRRVVAKILQDGDYNRIGDAPEGPDWGVYCGALQDGDKVTWWMREDGSDWMLPY